MLRKRTTLFSLFALVSISLCGGVLTGCSKDAAVSKTEEEQFKNPPKEMPQAAKDYMKNHGAGGKPATAK